MFRRFAFFRNKMTNEPFNTSSSSLSLFSHTLFLVKGKHIFVVPQLSTGFPRFLSLFFPSNKKASKTVLKVVVYLVTVTTENPSLCLYLISIKALWPVSAI